MPRHKQGGWGEGDIKGSFPGVNSDLKQPGPRTKRSVKTFSQSSHAGGAEDGRLLCPWS